MSKFSFKTEHILTPLKMVLPGIIVSLIGATAGYYIFANPEKAKAKATYASWNVIREYEDAYARNLEETLCINDSLNIGQFQKDQAYLLAVLVNNLEEVKREKNLDMRMKAFLNLKIARYSEAKDLTEMFIDSVVKLNKSMETATDKEHIMGLGSNLTFFYSTQMGHLEGRDTNSLKRIALALNKQYLRYTDSFLLKLPRTQTLDEMKKNVIGKWRFPEIAVTIEFKKDSTGIWTASGTDEHFTWGIDGYKNTLRMNFETEYQFFFLSEVTATKLTAVWNIGDGVVVVACRR